MRYISLSLLLCSLTFAAEVKITILATNDIHGGVEPSMASWATMVKNFRSQANVLLVDAGDQFQGTLISNYNEGDLVFSIMKIMGYDAIVPGNHDYDFGPSGWLVDQSSDQSKRREALEKIFLKTQLPLVSSNTFIASSMMQPFFLKPYVIKNVEGVRVALIGIDNAMTAQMTTLDNVADLYFGNEEEHYRRVRESIKDQADIFVLLIHNGDSSNEKSMTQLVKNLTSPTRLVDVVVSGHTHVTYNHRINGVPFIQSGSGGERFGKIELVWNTETKRIDEGKTQSMAGIAIANAQPDQEVAQLIKRARDEVSLLANRPIGKALKEIKRDYTRENALANLLTDAIRQQTHTDIAFLNGGGIRANLPGRELTYDDFYKVIPFNNHGVVISPMHIHAVLSLIERSIKTCGAYGALFQSGLRVTFQRNCANSVATNGIDVNAKLLHVEMNDGRVLYDAATGVSLNAPQNFQVSTADFLASGGSGFVTFKDAPVVEDFGIMRETLVEQFTQTLPTFSSDVDGRWKNVAESAAR